MGNEYLPFLLHLFLFNLDSQHREREKERMRERERYTEAAICFMKNYHFTP